jgi:dTDP-4-dehydrorhamnose 3,5-epimerase
MDHAKLVYCAEGSIFDAVVDLRPGQRFGHHESFQLSGGNAHILYLPVGVAHGFCVLSKTAMIVYNVTREYSPENDMGVRWDSCGIAWPVENPCISDRDHGFPALTEIGELFRI